MEINKNKRMQIILVLLVIIDFIIGFSVGYFLSNIKSNDPVVAEYDGIKIRGSEAFSSIKTRLFDIEDELFQIKEQAIRGYIEDKLLKKELEKQKLNSVEALLNKELGKDSESVDDKEVEIFLSSKGLSLDDPRIKKEAIKEYLTHMKKFQKRHDYVDNLMAKAKTKIYLTPPEPPIVYAETEGFPSWGNPKAPITIVEFTDFMCPYCSRALPILKRIKEEYGEDKIRIVFRDLPLASHSRAIPASIAAHCAHEQGMFWQYHDIVFENQTALEDNDLKDYAQKLNLDMKKFEDCFKSKRPQAIIEKSMVEADSLGIQGTPSFIINGTLMRGLMPYEKFKEKIDQLLKNK